MTPAPHALSRAANNDLAGHPREMGHKATYFCSGTQHVPGDHHVAGHRQMFFKIPEQSAGGARECLTNCVC